MNLIKTLLSVSVLGLGVTAVQAQSSYSDWFDAGQPELEQNAPNSPNTFLGGGFTTFADLASFQTAVGAAIPSEDFESGLVQAAEVATCVEPVNSASNDSCYTPGSLIPGFNVTSSSGSGVVTLGSGLIGNSTTVIGANQFDDTTSVSFDAEVFAVGLDVMSGGAVPVTVTAFDSSSNTIGSVTVNTSGSGVPTFVGLLSSATPIDSITLSDDTGGGELFDNLTFGPIGPPPTVPLFNIYTVLLLLLLLAAVTWKVGFRKQS